MDLDRGHLAPGTTSACAENTIVYQQKEQTAKNYLRVRGEYLGLGLVDSLIKGTTSACAENTGVDCSMGVWPGNYLRVRGEYLVVIAVMAIFAELPPRARRIHRAFAASCSCLGTTSACAENTLNELGLL